MIVVRVGRQNHSSRARPTLDRRIRIRAALRQQRTRLTRGDRAAPLGRAAAVHLPRPRLPRAQTLPLLGADNRNHAPNLQFPPDSTQRRAHVTLGGEHEPTASAPAHAILMMNTRDPKKIDRRVMKQLNAVGATAVPAGQLTQRNSSIRAQRSALRNRETASIATAVDRNMLSRDPTKRESRKLWRKQGTRSAADIWTVN
ncbi:MAG: hypothetical protein ACRDTW_11095 [Rhodococcus qingshengii]